MTTPEERFEQFRFSKQHPSEVLRDMLKNDHYVFAPGLYNAGGVKLAAHAGFKAAYLSGFSYALEEHGTTDVGAFSRSELTQQAKRMVIASRYWVREQWVQNKTRYNELPLIMDMEDGHGGFGQVQTMMQDIIPMRVAAGHIEDQAERRCGHLPGKVIVSTEKQIERLKAARSEADQLGNDSFVLIARTDACTAKYTPDGPGNLNMAVERTLAYARAEIHNRQCIDMAWCEFPNQMWGPIKYWADKVRTEHPNLPLAINLSSSFDWTNTEFMPYTMEELADIGFKYMFMTLADNHAGRMGSWDFFKSIQSNGIKSFAHQQMLEKLSGTPSISHNELAGTKTYFAGASVFGSKSFTQTIADADGDISEE